MNPAATETATTSDRRRRGCARVAALLLVLPAAAQTEPAAPQGRELITDDGSRFLLWPTGGPPLVHWVIATPAGPLEEPDGLEGLSFATARAAMSGTVRLGSHDRRTELELLDRLDATEQQAAILRLAGRELPPAMVEALRLETGEALAAADQLAWERAVRAAPASPTRLSQSHDAVLLQVDTTVEAVPRVAQLLRARREDAVLRAVHDELRQVRAEMAANAAADAWTPLREELRLLAFRGHRYGRPSLTPGQPSAPISREQALAHFSETQRPDRSRHVLTGGFDPAVLAPVLRRAFARSRLPAAPLPVRLPPPPQRGERTGRLEGATTSAMAVAYRPDGEVDLDAVQIAVTWLADGDDSFLGRWLFARQQRATVIRGTFPYPGPAAPLALIEVAAPPDTEAAAATALFTAIDRGLTAAAGAQPRPAELAVARGKLESRRSRLCAEPGGLATFLALRWGSAGMPLDRARRPLAEIDDAAIASALRQLLEPSRRVLVRQEARK